MRDMSAEKIKERIIDCRRRRDMCFLYHELLSLAKTLRDKENRFNFPNARAVSLLRFIRSSSFSSFLSSSSSSTSSNPVTSLYLSSACPIPSPSGSFSTSASSFPRLFRSRPRSHPLVFHCVRPARSGSSQSDVNLRSTLSNLRDERTFFG